MERKVLQQIFTKKSFQFGAKRQDFTRTISCQIDYLYILFDYGRLEKRNIMQGIKLSINAYGVREWSTTA